MFLGALLLFFALAHVDQYESLILPLLSKDKPSDVASATKVREDEVLKVLVGFNDALKRAYSSLNPSGLFVFSMSDELRQNYLEELAFLKRDGRTMEVEVGAIKVKESRLLSPFMLKVRTVEPVAIRYVNIFDGTEIKSYPVVNYTVEYIFEIAPYGYKVVSVKTVQTEKNNG